MKKLYLLFSFIALFASRCIIAQDTMFIKEHRVIEMGETMVIAPGTVVVITGQFKITVVGTVTAQGTKEKPIKFTANYNPDDPEWTTWRGFNFQYTDNNPTADSSVFEYCTFEYGFAYSSCSTPGEGGAIEVHYSSRLRFSDCIFQNCYANYIGGAISAVNSDIILERCIFIKNNTNPTHEGYGGALSAQHSAIQIRNCVFTGNSSASVGGSIFFEFCDNAIIENCEFTLNHGSTGGSMFIKDSNDMLFTGNLIHDNSATYFGGGMAVKNSNFSIINCTIANNFAPQGGGFYCSSASSIYVFNTIFASNEISPQGNGNQIYIAFAESVMNMSDCAVEGGKYLIGGSGGSVAFAGTYNNIIEETIYFEEDENYSYNLPANSPCVDAGNMKVSTSCQASDIAGHVRVFNSIIDIGALERIDILGINNEQPLCIYPNPANNFITICCNNNQNANYRVLNINGDMVLKSKSNNSNYFTIDVSNLKDGIYFLNETSKNKSVKFIINHVQ